MIPEPTVTTIELLHHHGRHMWGIPIGDGKYFYISQEMIDYVHDDAFLNYIFRHYDVKLTPSILNLMRSMASDENVYVVVPIPVEISGVWNE